jgi:FixJ family two-component response regulator
MDGRLEQSRADTHLPIIFITGYGDIPMTVRAMKAGAVEFLIKPFREQDLLDAVQLALQRDRDRRIRESAVFETRARFEAKSRANLGSAKSLPRCIAAMP